MKKGLFIVSFAGFIAAAYFLAEDLFSEKDDLNHFIYTSLLVILLFNSLIGLMMVFPENFKFRRKLKIRYAEKKSVA